uniref:NACHT, LRR and PYD domains-containing protein 12-like n=1 Tax=Pristiophorus japonicus TaxID=55135 RepID=UPI00398F1851
MRAADWPELARGQCSERTVRQAAMGSVPSKRSEHGSRRGRTPPGPTGEVTSSRSGIVVSQRKVSLPSAAGARTAIEETLACLNDFQLFRVTQFYRPQLQRVLEEVVVEVSSILVGNTITRAEYEIIRDLVKVKKHKEAANFILDTVLENGVPLGRAMWSALLKVKSSRAELPTLLWEIQGKGPSLYFYITWSHIWLDLADYDTVIRVTQQQHKDTLRSMLEMAPPPGSPPTDPGSLLLARPSLECYPQLVAISWQREASLIHHEDLAQRTGKEGTYSKIGIDSLDPQCELFSLGFTKVWGGTTVLGGSPGIGKSGAVRRLVQAWANNPDVYPQFHFLLHFEAEQLPEPCSLSALTLAHYPYLAGLLRHLWSAPETLLFIFDGLRQMWGGPEPVGKGPESPDQVRPPAELVQALAMGRLLPGCCVLLCGRAPALKPLLNAEVRLWAKVLGLNGKAQREFFHRYCDSMGKRVEGSLFLRALCFDPSYCWLLCATPPAPGNQAPPSGDQDDPPGDQDRPPGDQDPPPGDQDPSPSPADQAAPPGGQDPPRGDQDPPPGDQDPPLGNQDPPPSDQDPLPADQDPLPADQDPLPADQDLSPPPGAQDLAPPPSSTTQVVAHYLRSLLWASPLAEGESPGDVLFRAGELAMEGVSQCNRLFGEEELVRHGLWASPLLSGLVQRAGSGAQYIFRQPALQDFLAALAQYLAPEGRDLLGVLRSAQSADQDGRYRGLLCFAMGLSCRASSCLLEDFLPPLPHRSVCQALQWLEAQVQAEARRKGTKWRSQLLPLAHLLFEARCRRLAEALAQSLDHVTLGAKKPKPSSPLSPLDCAALCYVLQRCQTINEFNFDNCFVQTSGVELLLPAFLNCKRLSLLGNNLRDEGVRLLCVVLRDPDCKVKDLDLTRNSLTPACMGDLLLTLDSKQTIIQLNLNWNELGDVGVLQLSEGLRDPKSTIQVLQLELNGLTEACVPGLVAVLQAHPLLRKLILDGNKLEDAGVRRLIFGLKKSLIHNLGLGFNSLTDGICQELVTALCVNRTIQRLSLAGNYLTDKSVPTMLNLILHCNRMQRIWLNMNKITIEGKSALVSPKLGTPALKVIV